MKVSKAIEAIETARRWSAITTHTLDELHTQQKIQVFNFSSFNGIITPSGNPYHVRLTNEEEDFYFFLETTDLRQEHQEILFDCYHDSHGSKVVFNVAPSVGRITICFYDAMRDYNYISFLEADQDTHSAHFRPISNRELKKK